MKNLFTGYVLSGGKSSRMGTDKAFLKIGEKTFLENVVEILKPNCEQVKIVLNKSQTHFLEKIPDGVSHIFDHFENRGAVGGIHSAFKDCKTEYAVILAVDLPFVTSEVIKHLCEIILQEKDFWQSFRVKLAENFSHSALFIALKIAYQKRKIFYRKPTRFRCATFSKL